MLKVMIVEDEELIREGLRKNIEWESLGLEVVGSAENGVEAIQLCKSLKPDILITDIRMPIVSGLELIEKVKADNEDTVFIIISGYDDFTYAQQAIKYGVNDYFLKPIELEKLTEKLRVLSSQISLFRSQKVSNNQLHEFVDHVIPFLKRQFFLELLYGPYENREIYARLCDLGIVKESYYYSTVLVQLQLKGKSYNANVDIEEAYSPSLINSFNNGDEVYLVKKNGPIALFAAIFQDSSAEAVKKRIVWYIEEIQKNDYLLYATYGTIIKNVDQLHVSFINARDRLLLQQLFGYKRLDEMSIDTKSITVHSIDFPAVEEAIKQGDEKRLAEQLSYIQWVITSTDGNERDSMDLLENLFHVLSRLTQSNGLNIDNIFRESEDALRYDRNDPSYENIFSNLKRLAHVLLDYSTTREDKSAKNLISKAKEYIHQHCFKWNFSMEDVADFLELNPSYFSAIFKNTEGTTYIDYVTRCRLDRAKQLLKNKDAKISSIAKKVGYQHPAYFNYLFKKHFQVTPSEFRMTVLD
ncbi:MAG TPA: response regulator [archaeon]|nr:response regulator [archaeon]